MFYAANVLLALEHLHQHGIVYRWEFVWMLCPALSTGSLCWAQGASALCLQPQPGQACSGPSVGFCAVSVSACVKGRTATDKFGHIECTASACSAGHARALMVWAATLLAMGSLSHCWMQRRLHARRRDIL